MSARLLTPSKITAWLDCAHYLTLRHLVDDGKLVHSFSTFGSMAQLLADKGMEHEPTSPGSEAAATTTRR